MTTKRVLAVFIRDTVGRVNKTTLILYLFIYIHTCNNCDNFFSNFHIMDTESASVVEEQQVIHLVDAGIQTEENVNDEEPLYFSPTKILEEDGSSTTSSCFHTSKESSHSSTRRSSFESGLGTPLHLLFQSSSSSASSNIDSPTVATTPNILSGLDQLLHRITRFVLYPLKLHFCKK